MSPSLPLRPFLQPRFRLLTSPLPLLHPALVTFPLIAVCPPCCPVFSQLLLISISIHSPSLTFCLLTTAFYQPVQCSLASTSPCPRLLSSYCLLHRVVSVSSAASCPPPHCSSAVALPSSPFLSLPPPSPGLNMLPLADLSSPPLSSLWGLCHHAQASVKRRVRLGNATHIHGS